MGYDREPWYTTKQVETALRKRAADLASHHDVSDLLMAADELNRLDVFSNQEDDDGRMLSEILALKDSFKQLRIKEGIRFTALQRSIQQLKELIMPLQPEVQALVDQIAANTSAEASSAAALTVLGGQIATLEAKLGAVVPGAPVDAENLAAIVAQTALLKSSLEALVPAIPANTTPDTPADPAVPVDPVVVDAAANVDAAPAPVADPAPADPAPADPVVDPAP